jgi:hypothetical protein
MLLLRGMKRLATVRATEPHFHLVELKVARLDELVDRLEIAGLLLLQDKKVASVVGIIAGETLQGSWWSHPKAGQIFVALASLRDHPDVLFVKLVGGKVTLVHRRLWPALLAVAGANEPWQMSGLSREARNLLAQVRRQQVASGSGTPSRELQERLLVHATEVHTETGAHKMALQSWPTWAKQAGVKGKSEPGVGKKLLEQAAQSLGIPLGTLPWHRFKR